MIRLIVGSLMSVTAMALSFSVVENAETITVYRDRTPVLVYHKAENPAPPGKDPAFRRSGFIHPLYSPAGAVLTGTRPADHLHHMGIWHAWVNCTFRGQKVDFWNLVEKTGTVRYHRTLSIYTNSAAPGFDVEQEHVAFMPGGGEVVILKEELRVRIHPHPRVNFVLYTMVQSNVTDAALELGAYRYGGGIAFRGPPRWVLDNSDYLTSEGRTRADSHQSRARWCAMYGPTDHGIGTVILMDHPGNHDSPQRLRTWHREHGGAVFCNFVPIQERPWRIDPGQTVVLRYAVVATDGRLTVDEIEALWKSFAEL